MTHNVDFLVGTRQDDVLNGGDGKDILIGRGGDDILNGGAGNDILLGGRGDDILNGGEGNDLLLGGKGDDTLDGGAGNDYIFAGKGDDEIIYDVDENAGAWDFASGGRGVDTLTVKLSSAQLAEIESTTLIADFEALGGWHRWFNFNDYNLSFDFDLLIKGVENLNFVVNNQAPVAVDDFFDFEIPANGSTTFTILDVTFLENDFDPDGDEINVVSADEETALGIELESGIISGGSFAVTFSVPEMPSLSKGEILEDSFNYTIEENTPEALQASAVFNYKIVGVNDAPVLDTPIADVDYIPFDGPFALNISTNFSDVDTLDTLTYSDGGTLAGTGLVLDVNTGEITGVPVVGNYDISITATDDHGAFVSDDFNLEIRNVTDVINDNIFGSDNDDILVGGDSGNLIVGNAGNDTLTGGTGNDFLIGNEGDDILNGGGDNDILNGGLGSNTIDGGDGADTVVYDFDSSEFLVSVSSSNGEIISVNVSGQTVDITDTLTNVEFIQFTDTIITL